MEDNSKPNVPPARLVDEQITDQNKALSLLAGSGTFVPSAFLCFLTSFFSAFFSAAGFLAGSFLSAAITDVANNADIRIANNCFIVAP